MASQRVKAVALGLALVAGSVGLGLVVLPPALRQWQEQAAADDPAALSALRLDAVASSQRIAAGLDAALTTGDAELAESFMALASERGIAVAEADRQRLGRLKEQATATALADFGQGFLSGARESGAGFAGALAGDITGFGDLRDLAGEGRRWLGGDAPDGTILMLAAGGLAISAATWLSLGAALPARNGLSLVKAAARAKWL
ncbi:MAG: hypothetical protein ACK4VM_09325, partial [Bosea sp. (in: a-proteobacteria)]